MLNSISHGANLNQIESIKSEPKEIKKSNTETNEVSKKSLDSTLKLDSVNGKSIKSISLDIEPPSNEDLAWFMKVAEKFFKGVESIKYEPTKQDTERYKKILAEVVANKSPKEDNVKWAIEFEDKILKGIGEKKFIPSKEEKQKFDNINKYLKDNNLEIHPMATNTSVHYVLKEKE